MSFFCIVCETEHPRGECPLKGMCVFCKAVPATLHLGDLLSFTHGGVLNCCELCAAEKQLEHARERASKIPELEDRVVELRAARETGGS